MRSANISTRVSISDSLNADQNLSIILNTNPGFSEFGANPDPDLGPHQGFRNI
jgi:hypothetical protein